MPDELTVENAPKLNDPQTIANQLNKHFVRKGPKLASKLPNLNKSILSFMGNRNPCSMVFDDITVSEVVNIVVKYFLDKLSSGHDNIPSLLIKWSITNIAPILANIFNDCVNSGQYPNSLKIAKVTPLFKNGDTSVADNYRPISVLPQIDKIFEKLIHERMVAFESQHKFLKKTQFGFRKGHSTSHGITHLNEQVIDKLEKKKLVLYCL